MKLHRTFHRHSHLLGFALVYPVGVVPRPRRRSQVRVEPRARKGGWIVPMPAHHQPRGELPVDSFQIGLQPSVDRVVHSS
jgi:hypothetical protein